MQPSAPLSNILSRLYCSPWPPCKKQKTHREAGKPEQWDNFIKPTNSYHRWYYLQLYFSAYWKRHGHVGVRLQQSCPPFQTPFGGGISPAPGNKRFDTGEQGVRHRGTPPLSPTSFPVICAMKFLPSGGSFENLVYKDSPVAAYAQRCVVNKIYSATFVQQHFEDRKFKQAPSSEQQAKQRKQRQQRLLLLLFL